MSIQARGILIVACVLFGSLCLMGAGANAPAPAGQGGEPSPVDAVATNSVLIEAFVVEVNLPALAQQGVSPIGRQPHAVSVADILKCLDSGQARVLGGEKIAGRPGEKMRVETKGTIYIRHETGPSQVDYSPYASGEKFSVEIESIAETAVLVGFSYATTRVSSKQSSRTSRRPPRTGNGPGRSLFPSARRRLPARPRTARPPYSCS